MSNITVAQERIVTAEEISRWIMEESLVSNELGSISKYFRLNDIVGAIARKHSVKGLTTNDISISIRQLIAHHLLLAEVQKVTISEQGGPHEHSLELRLDLVLEKYRSEFDV